MKIGLLQAGHAPDALRPRLGDYGEMFTAHLDGHGFSFEIWSVVDMEFPTGPDDADGWLITGSRHGAYDDLPFIAPLEDLVRAIDAAALPLVGVCFGHQIIAQALGGRVEKYSDGWSVGATDYTTHDGQQLTLNAWHQDQVTERPARARVLASSEFCENAVLAYGDRIWSVQPHPEFSADMVDGLARTRGPGLVPDALLAEASARLGTPTHSPDIAAHMAQFFLSAHAARQAAA